MTIPVNAHCHGCKNPDIIAIAACGQEHLQEIQCCDWCAFRYARVMCSGKDLLLPCGHKCADWVYFHLGCEGIYDYHGSRI